MVGPRRALAVEAMRVADWNWIGEDQRQVGVKVRSLAPSVAAVREGDWIRFGQSEMESLQGRPQCFTKGRACSEAGLILEMRAAELETAAAA